MSDPAGRPPSSDPLGCLQEYNSDTESEEATTKARTVRAELMANDPCVHDMLFDATMRGDISCDEYFELRDGHTPATVLRPKEQPDREWGRFPSRVATT